MTIYFDNGGFVLSKTQLICYTIKVEIGVTEQFSVFNIFPFPSIVEIQFVYKIVRFNLTIVNAAWLSWHYTAGAYMLFILTLNSDTLLQKPISVKWKMPAADIFRDYDLLSRNSTFLSRNCHLLSRNYDSN